MEMFSCLSSDTLRLLASELRSGRLVPPYRALALQRWLDVAPSERAAGGLSDLHTQAFVPAQLAVLLEALAVERDQADFNVERCVQMVATGPEDPAGERRDTSAVVQSMFAGATESVYIAGFAIYQGREVFQVLADRMEQLPNLTVRMFVNIGRTQNDTSRESEIVQRFRQRFQTREWPPGRRLPQLFYDNRALTTDAPKRSSFHAKAVVVDHKQLFVTSANFTEAAQERNIEIGVCLHSSPLAQKLEAFLDGLVASQKLTPLTLPPR
ncbi:DISARM system phospholipase D-like protein DrmC [Anatilimnocola floriformis]|uniref:DISARM system phospholipase D-like protein DrmC n=1 Tax=Anatilimnocola floriformis TaxID=2948575 RepID=UPI0020C286A0|nr:DISARM system phospholipase D-like protein DrmC [Anatilimnocola floriformis]